MRCGDFQDAVFEREKISELLLEFLKIAVGKIHFEVIEIVEKDRLLVCIPRVFERGTRSDVEF